jgi:site-specific DNA recombinase
VRAAIYARFSTDRQDVRSLEDQRHRCERRAAERGWSVVDVFTDAAMSGATLNRSGLQELLASARRREFEVVLVDDLSRLSRDLGDTWTLLFRDLAGFGVQLLDVTTGLNSADPSAKLAFGASALVNEMQRESVRSQTRRGLLGLARAGYHTGGRVYGYTAVPETPPKDPANPHSILVINAAEAKVVRRIFREFNAGMSAQQIALRLNADGIAAPYDEARYRKRQGRGWSQVTVANLLRNRRYIGEVVFNRRRFVRTGNGTRTVLNPEAEWIRLERPELRLVNAAAFERAQTERVVRKRPGTPRERQHRSPVSGLLTCGKCGASMATYGWARKAGRTYRSFACAANRTRGPSICDNGRSIGETKVVQAIAETIRVTAADLRPEFISVFEVEWKRELAQRAATSPTADLDAAIARQAARVDRLAGAVADAPDIGPLLAHLREANARLGELRERRGRVAPTPPAPKVPSPEQIRGYFDGLVSTLEADPAAARGVLAAAFSSVRLVPTASAYRLELTMAEVCSKANCGGRI